MPESTILTPFFLDEPVDGLAALAGPDVELNDTVSAAGDRMDRIASLHRPIADFVAAALSQDKRPVSLAGDCCAAIPVAAGLRRAGIAPTLIWLDAHGDFNTWQTSPSGFLGGMPLAMIVGRGERRLVDAVGLESLPEADVVLTDARDLDPQEAEALAGSAVRHVADLRSLLDGDLPQGPLWVHFDADIVTADEAPAHRYPVPGGPSAAVVGSLCRRLAATDRIAAISFSAWHPQLDGDGRTQAACISALRCLTGADRV